MNGKSLTPDSEKIIQLKQLFPEVFSEEKIDWEKLQATLGKNINFANERYVLNWAGKSEAFRVMQQPSTQTLIPVKDESVDFHETNNIFIEGENMEVLKVLQKSYFGKVKMIYIDPPYNTGNDSFIYPDKFSETKTDYQKRVGDKDEYGYMTREGMFQKNSRENGQYHSNWLNMMMPRLYLAKNLLREDGVIFVSIDDNEAHNLRLLMNEIFGEENFVANITIIVKPEGRRYGSFAKTHENVLVFAKNIETAVFNEIEVEGATYQYFDNIGGFNLKGLRNRNVQAFNSTNRPNLRYPFFVDIDNPDENGLCKVSIEEIKGFARVMPSTIDGLKSVWRWGKEKATFESEKLVAYKGNDSEVRIFQKERKLTQTPKTVWADKYILSNKGTSELQQLLEKGIFDFPKPVELIRLILEIGLNEEDIVLDFFAGSATTAHAVMQLNKEDGGNRKFILVQLPEPCDEKSEAYKAGYKTIADIAKERIRRAGKKIQDEITEEIQKKKEELNFAAETDGRPSYEKLDTGFKVFKLSESNFKQWRQPAEHTAEELAKQLQLFIDPVAENANLENMVYELLLKSGKNLNVKIENNDGYYLIDGNELALLLERVDEQLIKEVLSEYTKKVIALDRIFNGNDQLKTNTALQMKDAGVEFKTI